MSRNPEKAKLGNYLIKRELGKSIMGVIYEGFDPIEMRTVAIKTLDKSLINQAHIQDVLFQLRQAAKAASRLKHSNIVSIYEYDEDGDRAFVVGEQVIGISLQDYFLTGKRFQIQDSSNIISQVLEALEYSHARGLVHREIRPANIVISKGGLVKVADFGIASIMHSKSANTESNPDLFYYQSPEQLLGKNLDQRSDIYSVGVILYQFLTGVPPFIGEDAASIRQKVLNEYPTPFRDTGSNLQAAMNKIVMNAIAKNPEERFPSCTAFLNMLKFAMGLSDTPAQTTTNQPKQIQPVTTAPSAPPRSQPQPVLPQPAPQPVPPQPVPQPMPQPVPKQPMPPQPAPQPVPPQPAPQPVPPQPVPQPVPSQPVPQPVQPQPAPQPVQPQPAPQPVQPQPATQPVPPQPVPQPVPPQPVPQPAPPQPIPQPAPPQPVPQPAPQPVPVTPQRSPAQPAFKSTAGANPFDISGFDQLLSEVRTQALQSAQEVVPSKKKFSDADDEHSTPMPTFDLSFPLTPSSAPEANTSKSNAEDAASFGSSLLASLASEASVKLEAKQTVTMKTMNKNQKVHEALNLLIKFFEQLIKHANQAEPAINRNYRLDAKTIFTNMRWHHASMESRKTSLNEKALWDHILIVIQLATPKFVVLQRPWHQLEALKKELIFLNLQTVEDIDVLSRRPQQEFFQAKLQPNFPVQIKLSGDYLQGIIVVECLNIDGFGSATFKLDTDDVNSAFMDSLGGYLLGRAEKLPPSLKRFI